MYIKKRWIILSVTFAVAVVAVIGGFALTFYFQSEGHKATFSYQQKENIASLAESLEQIDLSLKKGKYAASPYQAVVLATDIMLKAGSAKTALEHLPITDVRVYKTAKYLSQTGEFVLWLAEKGIKGEEITPSDAETLSSLSKKATSLAEELRNFGGEVSYENYGFDDLSAFYGEGSVFERVESLFDGSSLCYDGKYSDAEETAPDAFWDGKTEVSVSDAKKIAAFVMDVEPSSVSGGDEVVQCGLSCYTFEAYNGDRQAVIIKKGGYLFSYINNSGAEGAFISTDVATVSAEKFLKNAGFSDMTETEYRYDGNVLFITFVSEKDGVIIYPEKVVVGISAESGAPVLFTSADFWANLKKDRVFGAKISEDEAAKKVSDKLEIKSVKKAFLKSDGGREYPCYEFSCIGGDGETLVYINSETGVEERIILISETENGIFRK